MPAATAPADVTVEGLDMSDDHVTVAWPEGTDPYAAWAGVLARTREVVASEVAAIRAVGRAGRRRRRDGRLGQPGLGGREPGTASRRAPTT